MKKVIVICLFLLAFFPAVALPYTLSTWYDGCMEASADYTLTIPDWGTNWGGQLNIYSPYHWGIGFSFIWGQSLMEGTIGFLGFIDIPNNPYLVVPVNVKLGFVNKGYGLTLETGLKYFFGEITGNAGISQASYFTADLLGGVHICVWPVEFLRDPDDDNPDDWLIPSISANLGFCFPLVESGYYYY